MSLNTFVERNNGTHQQGPAGPAPPPPPPPAVRDSEKRRSSLKNCDADSHESTVEKLTQRLVDWNSFGGSASGLVISRYVQHIPQVGPKCGIVALNMALSIFLEKEICVEEILQVARERRYTNHGEMFSAENLRLLALNFTPHIEVQMINSEQLRDGSFIATSIAAGDVLLVPYDSARNFSPECLRGHKAHWAIITGIIIPLSEKLCAQPLHNFKSMEPGPAALAEVANYLPSNFIHVLALQGKSRLLSAWPLLALAASNENLFQFDPEREASDLEYIVPEGGLRQGLCGKALLFKSTN
ncbi:actin maturation protease [Cloeon dipterum]|uniref:actin maturation protease n=1 Tax=Cloeon dipterum TaxID=197152 RepID=UPI0032209734